MGFQTTALLGLVIGLVTAEYPPAHSYSSGKYPPATMQSSGKYPPAGSPDPGPGTGPAPTGPSGGGPSGGGPSGPGPSGGGPSGPGPSGPGPSGLGPSGPGPFPWAGGPGPFGPGPIPFGPSGPGPFPFSRFPWGPTGPAPYPPVPFPPPHFGGAGSVCAALDRLRVRALRATRPLLVGGIGAALLWAVKQIVIPNIAVFATAFRRRMGLEEDSTLDRMASEVSRAISNGACIEKVACALGQTTARNYPSARHLVRLIDPKSTGFMENFTTAFQQYVSGQDQDCEALKCPSS